MPVNVNSIRQSNALRKAFGVLGGFRIRLDETVVPVAVVDTFDSDGFKAAGGGIEQGAGGVGVMNVHALANPPDSGVLLRVDEITVSSGTAGNLTYFFGIHAGAAGLAAPGVGGLSFLDMRGSNAVNQFVPAGQVVEGTSGAGGVAGSLVGIVTSSAVARPSSISLPYRLTPGFTAVVQIQDDNVELNSSWAWSERPLQDGDV